MIKKTVVEMDYKRWNHTAEERRIIRKYGGVPMKKYGYDGEIRGKPVEVRSTRKDDRYRIQKDVHEELIRKKGYYIFVRNGIAKKIRAKKVSEMIRKLKWYKDRNYPHKFVKEEQVF